jgi:putative flavoprotein involved in K+ transport
MHPKHIVLALGYTGAAPLIPELPGLADYAGEVMHSSRFSSGEDYVGKNVLVIGTGTSGHDIAFDLYNNGATVSMLQRGPACIVPISEAERYNVDYLNPAWTDEEVDQRRNSGFVYPLLVENSKGETELSEIAFAETFDGLRGAGMTLTIGEDATGWLMKLHRTFNGYYLDVGASQAIIDGGIRIVQLTNVEGFVPTGIKMTDGSVVEIDHVILATGYENTRTLVERLFGSDVANKVGPVGGIGEDGEHRNMCRPTGQPHLWMVFGGIMDARKMSNVLALQIVAQLKGVVPTLVRSPAGTVEALESVGTGSLI